MKVKVKIYAEVFKCFNGLPDQRGSLVQNTYNDRTEMLSSEPFGRDLGTGHASLVSNISEHGVERRNVGGSLKYTAIIAILLMKIEWLV